MKYAVIRRWKDNPTDFQVLEYFPTSGAATIYQASDPHAKWIAPSFGRQASLYGQKSNALYRLDKGELITVWRRGQWVTNNVSLKSRVVSILLSQ